MNPDLEPLNRKLERILSAIDGIRLDVARISHRVEAIEKNSGVLGMPTGVFVGCIAIGLAVACGLVLVFRSIPS